MRLDYADIAVMIEFIKDKALQEGKTLDTTEQLLDYLEDNIEGFINFINED